MKAVWKWARIIHGASTDASVAETSKGLAVPPRQNDSCSGSVNMSPR
jgi:hypothetical protein